jgi:putative Mn2+ efflux pump MntP
VLLERGIVEEAGRVMAGMEFVTVALVAVGLAMDALAVSIVSGASYEKLGVRHALRIAAFFGAFQALMPLVGYLAGEAVRAKIGGFDHWVAFGLLAGVGGKMVWESFKIKGAEERVDPSSVGVLLALSVATSIDALAIGVTLSFITSYVLLAAGIIGAVTFVLSYLGVFVGKGFGHFFENKIELFGGLVLIGIGVKVAAEHVLG